MIQRRVGRLEWKPLRSTALRTVAATAVMSASCVAAGALIGPGDGHWHKLAASLVPVSVGILTYLAAARLIGLEEPQWLLARRAPSGGDGSG
jgi:hypothetical protein